jgi:membrane-anchored protein YejM (alkaline phosphatase superfamily)
VERRTRDGVRAETTAEDKAASRKSHRWILGRVWVFNLCVSVLIGLSYLERLVEVAELRVMLFALLGLVSSLATLSAVPLALLWLGAGLKRLPWIQAVTWMLFQLGLYIDTRIYSLFGYHFNGAVLNLFVTRGSEDSYRIDLGIWVRGFAFAGVFVALELLLWRVAAARSTMRLPHAARLRRGAVTVGVLLAGAVGVEKSLYAHAEVTLDRKLTAASQVLPLYPRLSVVPFLPESVRDQLPEVPAVRLGGEPQPLAWPRAWPTIDPQGPRPDIVLLVVDSWRADALDERVTPRMAELAQSSRRFADHLSCGNGTRFGVFGMLYGLHGSYWWSVLAERRSPVLLDALLELGYDVRVFSAASQDFPEFRSTAWSRIQEHVVDDIEGERQWTRDERAADACIAWWRARPEGGDRRPSFTFVLLDSAHQTYDFPDGQAPFQPYAQELDYFELSSSHSKELAERVKNRYLNALHHADSVAGRLVDALAEDGELDDTLLVVTGDHGEEFAENGFWGHTGNFTPEQVAVPLFVRGPGIEPGLEARPTSHLDLAPTLLELLGADPAQRGEWCLGANLLAPPAERRRVVAGWTEIGVQSEWGILRVPRAPSAEAATSVWTSDWHLVEDQAAALTALRGELEKLDLECNRFLATPAL